MILSRLRAVSTPVNDLNISYRLFFKVKKIQAYNASMKDLFQKPFRVGIF